MRPIVKIVSIVIQPPITERRLGTNQAVTPPYRTPLAQTAAMTRRPMTESRSIRAKPRVLLLLVGEKQLEPICWRHSLPENYVEKRRRYDHGASTKVSASHGGAVYEAGLR